MQDRRLCVLNAGSSSLKFAVYGVADGGPSRLQSGEVERIGGEGRLLITSADGKAVHDRMVTTTDHAAALAMLASLPDGRIVAVEQGNLLGLSFHPEITGERRFHELFLKKVHARTTAMT